MIHQGKFPWFISILPVILSAVLAGIILPRVKTKYFPNESDKILRQLAQRKSAKLQFLIHSDGKSLGVPIDAGVLIIRLQGKPKRYSFIIQNIGDAPVEGAQMSIQHDCRLLFSHDFKTIPGGVIHNLPPNECGMLVKWEELIYPPSLAAFNLTFHETNLLNTGMNLNFAINAKGIDRFPVLLTCMFVPGGGPDMVYIPPGLSAANKGQQTFTIPPIPLFK